MYTDDTGTIVQKKRSTYVALSNTGSIPHSIIPERFSSTSVPVEAQIVNEDFTSHTDNRKVVEHTSG